MEGTIAWARSQESGGHQVEREAVGVYESQKSATERRSIYLITLCLSLFFWGVTSVTSFFFFSSVQTKCKLESPAGCTENLLSLSTKLGWILDQEKY